MPFSASVLQVIPALRAGGAERTTIEIARAIVAAGGRAFVASSGGEMEVDVAAAGGEIVRLPAHAKNPLTMAVNAVRLERTIRAREVDIVHVRSRAPAWSSLWAARRTGARLVATYHGAYGAQTALKRFYNSGMLRGDAVIANSEFTAAAIRSQYATPAGRLTVIPRGADLAYFDPHSVDPRRVTALAEAWGLNPESGALRLLAPGRLTSWKGQMDAIEAVARLASGASKPHTRVLGGSGQPHAFELVICGSAQGNGAFERALRQSLSERGDKFMARIVGHCADMPAAYRWADIVLAPSRRPEAFGRVAVEAGAMARPVIAAAHGGALETVVDGETGLLTPPGDPDAIADAVAFLARAGREGREGMGRAARARIVENFSTASMCAATLSLYQRVLEPGQQQ